jgi:phospholipid transport system substrate-binding protein
MRALLTALALVAAGGSPTETLKARDAEIRAALPPEGRVATAAERTKLEKIVTRTIDLRGMAEEALGERWQKMTEKQRKRLTDAFESRFRKAYGSDKLDSLRSTEIEYQPERPANDAVQVPTRVVVEGEPTQIVYTMRQGKEGWRIVDITVDGVSTVENYRSSFNRVIAKDGVEGLIQKLEKGPTGRT